ncbi:uncharacterized protein AKAW2_80069A [Aspergillus luchuensis]|uniref:Uncharacterized protein n=1 Tax=Aspergillus kawachii TaxID=1069201 RepID=A0A7R8A4V2_ASPKA|nr:uncharacterized protein AKAW2_80069A [Aspergillus luchuensis]BCS04268.1 hypothetical protein AKAW2_80069A [Aspergillus luchuensis]
MIAPEEHPEVIRPLVLEKQRSAASEGLSERDKLTWCCRTVASHSLPDLISQEQMHLTYHAYDIGANGPVKYLCRVKSYFIFFPTVISWASDFLRTTYHNV